jgi:hypothetical protein
MKLISSGSKTENALPPDAPRWLRLVPMLTGVLAGIGGYLTIRSTNLSNEAIFWSTQATLQQDKATDTWVEYQAASIKAHQDETLLMVAPAGVPYVASLNTEAKGFRDKQPQLKQQALAFEGARENDLKGGIEKLKQKDLLGYAGMAVQVGIALASVAALVRNPLAFYAAIACGLVGAGMVGYVLVLGWMH